MTTTASPPRDYAPISCALVDELQLRALRGSEATITHRDADGETTLRTRVADVRTRNGAEWLVLSDGREIRLDDLIEVDGIPFPGTC